MKKISVTNLLFTLFLVLSCCAVYGFQHALASLTYLPNNQILSLAILTPALLVFTFFTTFTMMKKTRSSRPVLGSVLSTLAMLLPLLSAGIYFLCYVSRRYAGALPVPLFISALPEPPVGIVTLVCAALCLIHLTALLLCNLIKGKVKIGSSIFSIVNWLLLNAALFLLTV